VNKLNKNKKGFKKDLKMISINKNENLILNKLKNYKKIFFKQGAYNGRI